MSDLSKDNKGLGLFKLTFFADLWSGQQSDLDPQYGGTDDRRIGGSRQSSDGKSVVGPWGSALVNFAVIVSLGGALFTYTILCMDSAFQPATHKSFPDFFARVNQKNAPTVALIASTLIIQFFLIIVFFNESTYQIMYTLSTSAIMFPYALSGLYLLKITISGEAVVGLTGGKKTLAWAVALLGEIQPF